MQTADILAGFFRSLHAFPKHPAVEACGVILRYEELFDEAAGIAATLLASSADTSGLTGVLAYRSTTAFTGVLAALLRGNGYVPFNRTFPIERTRAMLQRAGCAELIVDAGSEQHLHGLLQGLATPLLVLLPQREHVDDLSAAWPLHTFLSRRDLRTAQHFRAPAIPPDALAYVLFTSGSTGTPKGVPITRQNVRAFVEAASSRYDFHEEDRFSQYFDLTFDLSVFDMFMAWECGACVCCLAPGELIAPSKFINAERLSVWFSVPSTIGFMMRLGQLKPSQYPGLRWSLFCGEALPVNAVNHWSAAAPNSVVENLYGPTELTIACTAYRCDPRTLGSEAEQSIAPIGTALPNMELLVVDEQLREVAPGETGELIGTGPQLARGYLSDPEKTATAFVRLPGRAETYYRTGDLVRRPAPDKPITFLDRIDNQIKVHGFRVEPGEIEALLREAAGVPVAVAVGWPRTTSGASGIVAFLGGCAVEVRSLHEQMRRRLPDYMVPREYHMLQKLPRNANGKLDRKALLKWLEDRQ